ncbi:MULTISPECIES: TraK family protein [unclassified Gluconobacter]|uniref:TraK family protein n=1 Tax=unclassified Gluconobacter TaxID=2644261 RepID=UPI001C04A7D3|nr:MULTISPECIES: TraK family protein [unclassified Gluconobacter]
MTPSKKGMARVRFIALKDVITKELEQGYNRTDIFQKHYDTLLMSYSQFTRHIQKFIVQPSLASSTNVQPIPNLVATLRSTVEEQPSPKRHSFTARPVHFDPDPDKIKHWLSPVPKD